jgi:hypothetical protein
MLKVEIVGKCQHEFGHWLRFAKPAPLGFPPTKAWLPFFPGALEKKTSMKIAEQLAKTCAF